jgi:hypothetical protein
MVAHAESITTGVQAVFLLTKSMFKHVSNDDLETKISQCKGAYALSLQSLFGRRQKLLEEPTRERSDSGVMVHQELENEEQKNPDEFLMVHQELVPTNNLAIRQVKDITEIRFYGSENDQRVLFGTKEFFSQCSIEEIFSTLQKNGNPQSEALAIHLIFNDTLKNRVDPSCIILKTGLLTAYRKDRLLSEDEFSDFSQIPSENGSPLLVGKPGSQNVSPMGTPNITTRRLHNHGNVKDCDCGLSEEDLKELDGLSEEDPKELDGLSSRSSSISSFVVVSDDEGVVSNNINSAAQQKDYFKG